MPDAPHGITWSPDGKRIAYTMFVPDVTVKLGTVPDKPAGAKWAEPLQVIDAVVYRTDEGARQTRLRTGVLGAGRWWRANAADLRGNGIRGPLSWSADGRAVIFSANLAPDWQRDLVNTEVHAVSIDTLDVQTLTRRNGRTGAQRLARWQVDRLCRFRRPLPGLPDRQLSIMHADGSNSRV